MSMNKGFVSGNLARDGKELSGPESKTTAAAFTVASNYGKDKANFIQVKAFGELAEALLEYTEQGSKVTFEYHVQTNTIERDGRTQYLQELIADDAEF